MGRVIDDHLASPTPKRILHGVFQDGLTSLINPVQEGLTSVNSREPVSPLGTSRTWKGHVRNHKGTDQVRVPVSFCCLDTEKS